MGLDTVQLVMDVEEAFGIAIPDEEAARMRTPRMVLEYMATRLPVVAGEGERCPTQHAFYAARRGFCAAGVQRAVLRRNTSLRALSDRAAWPALWTRVRTDAGEPHWPEAVPWPGFWSRGPGTLGELAFQIATAWRPAPGQPWTRRRLELVLRAVIYDSTGVPEFSLDDDFVRDMKLD
jgi:hypothetical protein